MCLAWVSTCSLCFERGDSCTWGSMHRCPPMHGCPPQETTHWKSVAPSKWISMHRLCAPRVAYLMVRPCIAVPHEKPHIPSLSRLSNACRSVGSMPLGLFTMCLAWVSTCSLCFERGDSDTWGFHAQVSAHAWLSPTRNYTLEVCCTIQMDLYAQTVCPEGCLPYG